VRIQAEKVLCDGLREGVQERRGVMFAVVLLSVASLIKALYMIPFDHIWMPRSGTDMRIPRASERSTDLS
jgi:hypothetical protein